MLRTGPGQKAMVTVVGFSVTLALQGCGSGLPSGALGNSSSSSSGQSVSAPASLGYAWNAADRTLRPILGVVGSSRVGASIVPANTYVDGFGSATSSVALLVRADGTVDRITLPTAAAATLPGITVPRNAKVHFSPSGDAAVMFAAGGTAVVLVMNLSATPQAVSLAASSALLDVAVSDKGTVVMLQRQGAGSQLAGVVKGGTAQPVTSLGGAGTMTFLAKREDLLVTDAAANSLTLVRNVGASATLAQVPTANLLKTPTAVGAALDGRWVVVSNGAESSVARIDLNAVLPPQRIACPVQPSGVEQLAGNANFRFSDIGRSPAWLSDMSASTPMMLFVPAISGS